MDYLQWQSELSLEQVFAESDNVRYPDYVGDQLVFLTTIKDEENRAALMLCGDEASEPICLTPAPFDLRSKISEYGGKPYWIFDREIYFVNNADQRLYQQKIEKNEASEPVAISPVPAQNQCFMYADLCKVGSWVFAITEVADKESQGKENIHTISALDLSSDGSKLIQLVSGADFYSNLCISPMGDRLAWVQWDHPNMPWDETQLWAAEIRMDERHLNLKNQQRIEMAQGASVCQLCIANNGRLFFSVDFPGHDRDSPSNYWNIKSYDFEQQGVFDVTSEKAEFGYPHWQYGDARIVQFDEDRLLAFAGKADSDELYFIDQDSLAIDKVLCADLDDCQFQSLTSNGQGRAAAVIYSPETSPVLFELMLENEKLRRKKHGQTQTALSQKDISNADHFSFPTSDGNKAYGYYYAPVNSAHKSDAPPPLIVMVHGGPTARTNGFFDLQKQFWTSRGFAIFDVNHRGSTGYGRSYRDALLGQWGIIEINDIIDGVNHLVSQAKADEGRICIRGKSAGGYTVLRALTEHPTVFRAGACYYGIGNLATLAEITHKFEKYYTDRLIGERYASENATSTSSAFWQRSPINKVADLQTAMIIFQGLEDKIVPPAVAQEIVSALVQSDITHSYVEYSDEGHGFRQPQTNIDAWSRELAFYQRVLSQ